jgi:hypothetical protein
MTTRRQRTLVLLPPAAGKCPLCATEHNDTDAHNATSIFYHFRFKLEHQRDPTWSDAIAHLKPFTQALWKQTLTEIGIWSEHPNPIAEQLPKPNTLRQTARKDSAQHAANSPPRT